MRLEFKNVAGNGEVYMDCLRAICGDTRGKSMIDLCCCTAPNTPLLGFSERYYIDIIDRKLDHPEEQKFFHRHDALNVHLFMAASVDVMICSDGIEHFKKEDGKQLLEIMHMSSTKQVLFAPLGPYLVDENDKNPENHHSAWWPEDFDGYATIVFPKYHSILGVGAFFAWKCPDIKNDFERVKSILNNKSWVNL